MNREDIIRMAREAGIVVTGEAVWKLCELVAAREREALVHLAEGMDFGDGLVSISDLVDALKQRGEK
jgi:hypothetical protein